MNKVHEGTIFIGQSLDANQVTIIDDVKVSVESKGEFSGPEEVESAATNPLSAINGCLHSLRPTTNEKDLSQLNDNVIFDNCSKNSSLRQMTLLKTSIVFTCRWSLNVSRRKILFRCFSMFEYLLLSLVSTSRSRPNHFQGFSSVNSSLSNMTFVC